MTGKIVYTEVKGSDKKYTKFIRGHYDPIKAIRRPNLRNEVYFRSQVELDCMIALDADPDVIGWEYEPIRINYSKESIEGQDLPEGFYKPDFIVYRMTSTQLYEVKMIGERHTKINVAKRNIARRMCSSKGWDYVEWSSEKLPGAIIIEKIEPGSLIFDEVWQHKEPVSIIEQRAKLTAAQLRYNKEHPEVGRARTDHARKFRTSVSFQKGAKKLLENLAIKRFSEQDPNAPWCACGCGNRTWLRAGSKTKYCPVVYGHRNKPLAPGEIMLPNSGFRVKNDHQIIQDLAIAFDSDPTILWWTNRCVRYLVPNLNREIAVTPDFFIVRESSKDNLTGVEMWYMPRPCRPQEASFYIARLEMLQQMCAANNWSFVEISEEVLKT